MRHLNSSHIFNIHHRSKGVRTHLTREEITFPDYHPDEFRGRTVPQAFIVEWQMQPAETDASGEQTTREPEQGIYLH